VTGDLRRGGVGIVAHRLGKPLRAWRHKTAQRTLAARRRQARSKRR
jgi:hypothetical protein